MDLYNIFSTLIQTLKFWKSALDYLRISINAVWDLLVSENLGSRRHNSINTPDCRLSMSSFRLGSFMKHVDFQLVSTRSRLFSNKENE